MTIYWYIWFLLNCLEHSWWKSCSSPHQECTFRIWACGKGRCIIWWARRFNYCFNDSVMFWCIVWFLICCQWNIYVDFPLFFCLAMELALSLEKLVNEKLRSVHSVMRLYFSAFGFCFSVNYFFLWNSQIICIWSNRWQGATMTLNWQTSLKASFCLNRWNSYKLQSGCKFIEISAINNIY